MANTHTYYKCTADLYLDTGYCRRVEMVCKSEQEIEERKKDLFSEEGLQAAKFSSVIMVRETHVDEEQFLLISDPDDIKHYHGRTLFKNIT